MSSDQHLKSIEREIGALKNAVSRLADGTVDARGNRRPGLLELMERLVVAVEAGGKPPTR